MLKPLFIVGKGSAFYWENAAHDSSDEFGSLPVEM